MGSELGVIPQRGSALCRPRVLRHFLYSGWPFLTLILFFFSVEILRNNPPNFPKRVMCLNVWSLKCMFNFWSRRKPESKSRPRRCGVYAGFNRWDARRDWKERKWKEDYLYSAILYISKRSGMDHSFICKLHHACLSFVRVHRMAPPLTQVEDIQLQLTTNLSTPKD